VGTSRRLLAAGAACAALALAASPAAAMTAPEPPGGAPAPRASAHPQPGGPVTISFAGDVHFEGRLASRLSPTGLASLRPWVGAADVTMVNLETAITSRGTEAPKHYHFRTTPMALQALKGAGVDVVTMANNHAVDYGGVGLADTLRAVDRSPIGVVGIGRDAAQAFAPYVVDVRGTRIAFFGATDVPDWTTSAFSATSTHPGIASAVGYRDRLERAVRTWSARADVVVVYLHGGIERQVCPTGRQVSTASVLARAGADIVVTSHAHVLLGQGWRGRTFVSHGLGNFVWYSANSVREGRSGLLTVNVQGGRAVSSSFAPSAHSRVDWLPHRLSGSAARAVLADVASLHGCTGLASRPS
jgi:poly-gamma-glutamate synthesis protein (capsule biosynthesis protein)